MAPSRPGRQPPPGLTVIVGEEVKTSEGDLICVFLERAIPPGLSAAETIAAAREQGGLVGIPHPFDTFRGSLARGGQLVEIAPLVDWIEGHNARLVGKGNEQAVAFAAEHAKPVVAVSDAHSLIEIAVAYSALDGDPSTPAGLLAALADAELVPGRASYFVRSGHAVLQARPAHPGERPGAAIRIDRPAAAGGPMSEPGDGQDLRPMADVNLGPVASADMEANVTLDAAVGRPGPLTFEPVPEIDESDVVPVSLANRLRQPRTILSIVVPLAIIAFFLYLNRERLAAVPELILQANPDARSCSRSSCSTWASHCAGIAGRACSVRPASGSVCVTRRRSSTCRGSSTASCPPSWATSTGHTCSR